MIKAILFDWGGVIAPENNGVAAKILASKYGCDEKELFDEFYTKEFEYSKGQDCEQYYLDVSKNFKIPADVIEKTLNSVGPIKEMLDLVKKLKDKGFLLYLFSNQMKTRSTSMREKYDLSFFEDVFFSSEVGLQKPEKEFFEFVLNKVILPPNNCLFIDDNAENIEMANGLGIKTILFKDKEQFLKELESFSIKI